MKKPPKQKTETWGAPTSVVLFRKKGIIPNGHDLSLTIDISATLDMKAQERQMKILLYKAATVGGRQSR